MIDLKEILYEISENDMVFEKDVDLIDSGIIDSYVFIELFSRLEDYGILLQPTRIDRNKLRTIEGIEELINEYESRN